MDATEDAASRRPGRSGDSELHRVGSSNFGRHLTLGVEEELMLVDAKTFELAPGVEKLLGPEGLKTELFSCFVETNTPICDTAFEAHAEIIRLRGVVRDAARREGLAVAATGAHPFSRPEEQEIVQEPRYRKMLEELGAAARRQLVCGLHVHVGMESFETCLRTLERIVPWLPSVLALSLNSPYLADSEIEALSTRASRLLELPRSGAPPVFSSPAEWEAVVAAAGVDYTRIWWDARPHPRLGTLEIRIADQPTSVERAGALAALVQALCAAAPDEEPGGDYLLHRAAAAGGWAPTQRLFALVEPAARELGTWELVESLDVPREALRQLDVGRAQGVVAVAADLVARS